MSAHELDCRDLSASPGGSPILRGLSLTVPAGSRTALLGPSGAGKTTLLRAISGLQAIDAGEVRLGGEPIHGRAVHRRGIAMVFQEPRLLPHIDVQDNVALALRAAGVGRRERRRIAAAQLEEVGLAGLADRRVQGLSGGEQQRVALARALCSNPRLLLLDEPLTSLDPNRRAALRRVIVDLQRQRRLTTVIVTHDRSEAAELGQQIALMLEGRIVQHDEPRALFERPVSAAVARFFGVANLIPEGAQTLAIRPEHVRLQRHGGRRGIVVEAVYAGDHVRVVVDCAGQRLQAHLPPQDAPRAGEQVGLILPDEHLWRLPSGRSAEVTEV
ncbi:MAG: ABC transporter ATP-binding protein [Solirubrobacterales bacterium]|nr:ABC transporter ATP-binding protein [Solirubrobacterales bacterium]